jgi:hypothetical protein
MQVHLFRGPGRVFGVTASEAGDNLPAAFGPWTAFKSLEMVRGQPQPGVNVDECLDDIDRFGFHLTDAHVRITERATG